MKTNKTQTRRENKTFLEKANDDTAESQSQDEETSKEHKRNVLKADVEVADALRGGIRCPSCFEIGGKHKDDCKMFRRRNDNFVLSKKKQFNPNLALGRYFFLEKDVREFIRRLKEDILTSDFIKDKERIIFGIDTLAGEELSK